MVTSGAVLYGPVTSVWAAVAYNMAGDISRRTGLNRLRVMGGYRAVTRSECGVILMVVKVQNITSWKRHIFAPVSC